MKFQQNNDIVSYCVIAVFEMATPPDDIKYNVTCGVNEMDKKWVKLLYKVEDPEPRITFQWIHQPNEDGSWLHVAHLTALDSKRGHRSRPISDDIYKKLGSPKKKRKDQFYQVKMSRQDQVSIAQYFSKSSD